MDLKGVVVYGIFLVVFFFIIVELFDILVILIGLFKKVNLVDKNGKILGLNCVFVVDLIGIMVSVIFGSIVLNMYIENVIGIVEGGCIGLKVLMVVILFIFILFFVLFI